MCKCCSHGTFPLFSLQSFLLNICYYHQDLHRRPLQPGSHLEFCGDRSTLLLIKAWPLPRHLGIGHALQHHPFSGSSNYPKGNFGGNQLLDSLISLLPLYPSQMNDMHISIAVGLHQSFLWLCPAQA
ncbi:hypothetical protein SLA2020_245240 [Shorea laevis]